MAKKGSFSKVYDKNGDYADVEAVRFDGTRTVQMQGDVTATQTWNGDPNTPLTLNASIGAKKVTQDKIGDKAVGTGQMADGSVGLTQIAASAMTDSVSANNSKLVTSQGVNAAIAAATLNRGKDYGPMSVDEINAISETIPTGSTAYVEHLGTGDAKVINDGYSDGTMASFSVEVGEDLKYYRAPDNSLHGWYSTEANVKIKQPANYAGGIAVDSAQDASSGSAGIEFIQSFKQDTNGNMRDIVKAQVDLVDSTSSTRTDAAATPNSVKTAYDLANTANTGLANKLDKTGDGKDVTATFTEASSRANIGTGEKLSVMFGKIKKWFTDLKALAFKDTVSDSDISGTISDNHIASASTWNGKADKVSGATNGNLAALDSNGNLTDSGNKASDFELVTNKVTSFQTTPDDTHYPSEKLVKTALDGKADAINVVAIADGIVSTGNDSSIGGGWYKIAEDVSNLTSNNISSIFDLFFTNYNSNHSCRLNINIRANTSGSALQKFCSELHTDHWNNSIKIVTRGLSGNFSIEIWVQNNSSYSGLGISIVKDGGTGINDDKNRWTFFKKERVAGETEPVSDPSNNVVAIPVDVIVNQHAIASPTNNNLVAMDANGLVKNSGVAVLPSTSTWDGTSDAKVPTAKAVQAKLDAKADANKVVAIADAVVSCGEASVSDKWFKVAELARPITRLADNAIGLWNITFYRATKTFLTTAIINVRNNADSYIAKASILSEDNEILDEFDAKVVVRGLYDNRSCELWLSSSKNSGFFGFSISEIQSGNYTEGYRVKYKWIYHDYYGSESGSAEPQSDVSNNVVAEKLVKLLQQKNIPSPTNNNLVAMDANGLVKNSGVAVLPSTSTWDGTSDAKVPTAKAVQAKLDAISLRFMNNSEAVAIWADAKTAAANAS